MKRSLGIAVVSVVFLCGGSFAELVQGVNIDFVDIGEANNLSDSATGRGAVGYDYRIGTYEVTATQFAAAYSQDSNISNNTNENYWS